jgi:hypothetical protein
MSWRSAHLRALAGPSPDLEHHLMRCRRREEGAVVLALRVRAARAPAAGTLLRCLRLTDSARLRRTAHGWELDALFDEDGFDRDALERRLRATLNGSEPQLGWARFPEDGVTLLALLETARGAALERWS